MSDAKKAVTYFRGLPTEPDVNNLLGALPDLKPGDEIPNDWISEIIKAPWRSARFKTVVSVFRKKLLREKNIDTRCVPGVGVRILTEPERVTESIGGFRKGVRGVRKSAARISLVTTSVLSPEDQRRADFARRQMEATYSAAAKSAKDIADTYRPPQQLPKRTEK